MSKQIGALVRFVLFAALVPSVAPAQSIRQLDAGDNWQSSKLYFQMVGYLQDEAERASRDVNRAFGTSLAFEIGKEDLMREDLQTGWSEWQNRTKFRFQYVLPVEHALYDLMQDEAAARKLRQNLVRVEVAAANRSMFPYVKYAGGVLTIDVMLSQGHHPDRGPMASYTDRAVDAIKTALGGALK